MANVNKKLVAKRTFTGLTFLNITIRLEDHGTHIKDAVYFEMIGETGNGYAITMSWSLLKLQAFVEALRYIADKPSGAAAYKEHTQSSGITKTLGVKFEKEKKELWINMATNESPAKKVGKQVSFFECKAIAESIERMIIESEKELYTLQKSKNL